MKMHRTRPVASAALSLVLLTLPMGCSDSSDSKPDESAASTPKADTSYLDELAAKQGIALDDETAEAETVDDEAVEPVEIVNAPEDAEMPANMTEDEEREWVAARQSQSLLGRSRDKAKGLRDQLQGSTTPENGLASTISEDEYAASSGLRWEMPEDWAMAVPAQGRFAEMYIKNMLGNASVSFTKEADTTRDLIKAMQSEIVDPMGGRSKARTSEKTIARKSVTIVDLEGSYLDPGAKGGTKEQIFYAMHAAIFDLGDSRILIKMWGPQDTVNQSVRLFDKMINETVAQ